MTDTRLNCRHWITTRVKPGAPGRAWQNCELCGKSVTEIVSMAQRQLLREVVAGLPEKKLRPDSVGGVVEAWDSGFANGFNYALDQVVSYIEGRLAALQKGE